MGNAYLDNVAAPHTFSTGDIRRGYANGAAVFLHRAAQVDDRYQREWAFPLDAYRA